MSREIVHVLPHNDLREHSNRGFSCLCRPRVVEQPNSIIVIHRAYDLRDLYEPFLTDNPNPEIVN